MSGPPVLNYANAVGPGPLRQWADADGWHACASVRPTVWSLGLPWLFPLVPAALAVVMQLTTPGERMAPVVAAFALPMAAWAGWLTWRCVAGLRVEVVEVRPAGAAIPAWARFMGIDTSSTPMVKIVLQHPFGVHEQWLDPEKIESVEAVRNGRALRVISRGWPFREWQTVFHAHPPEDVRAVAAALRRALAEVAGTPKPQG